MLRISPYCHARMKQSLQNLPNGYQKCRCLVYVRWDNINFFLDSRFVLHQ